MKGFLWGMAIVFAILTVICFSNSIVSTEYGEVANMQMTVFAAASGVLCWISIVGALILTALSVSTNKDANDEVDDTVQNEIKKENENKWENADSAYEKPKTFSFVGKDQIKCSNCGEVQPSIRLNKEWGKCWKCGADFYKE